MWTLPTSRAQSLDASAATGISSSGVTNKWSAISRCHQDITIKTQMALCLRRLKNDHAVSLPSVMVECPTFTRCLPVIILPNQRAVSQDTWPVTIQSLLFSITTQQTTISRHLPSITLLTWGFLCLERHEQYEFLLPLSFIFYIHCLKIPLFDNKA